MKTTTYLIKEIDGSIFSLLDMLFTAMEIRRNAMLNIKIQVESISKVILAARADGLNWLWTPNDIYEDQATFKKTPKSKPTTVTEFCLPSVDIHRFFEFEGHSKLKEHLKKKHGITLTGISWDTEYSAWYPRFKTRQDAVNCIETFNKLFDKLYLKKIKALST